MTYQLAVNLAILERDDWIEVATCCVYGGGKFRYKMYSSGKVDREMINADGSLHESKSENCTLTLYEALSEIARTVTSNIEAMED